MSSNSYGFDEKLLERKIEEALEKQNKVDDEKREQEIISNGLYEYAKREKEDETRRENVLMQQAANQTIAISILIAFLGGILPFSIDLLGKYGIHKILPIICVAIVIAPLLAAIVLCIIMQWRFKFDTYKSSYEYQDHIEKNYEEKYKGNAKAYIDDQRIFFSDHRHSMWLNNNKRASCMRASHICFLISIGLFAFFILQLITVIILLGVIN